jgi:hypothetical protein
MMPYFPHLALELLAAFAFYVHKSDMQPKMRPQTEGEITFRSFFARFFSFFSFLRCLRSSSSEEEEDAERERCLRSRFRSLE